VAFDTILLVEVHPTESASCKTCISWAIGVFHNFPVLPVLLEVPERWLHHVHSSILGVQVGLDGMPDGIGCVMVCPKIIARCRRCRRCRRCTPQSSPLNQTRPPGWQWDARFKSIEDNKQLPPRYSTCQKRCDRSSSNLSSSGEKARGMEAVVPSTWTFKVQKILYDWDFCTFGPIETFIYNYIILNVNGFNKKWTFYSSSDCHLRCGTGGSKILLQWVPHNSALVIMPVLP